MSQGCNTKALSAVWVCFSALKVPLQTQTSTGEIVCETSRAGAQVLSSGLHCPPPCLMTVPSPAEGPVVGGIQRLL